MRKTSKQTNLLNGEKLVGIRVTKFTDGIESDRFDIPVVDVRHGAASRKRVSAIIKQQNIQRGSKYFKPSYSVIGRSYNQ